MEIKNIEKYIPKSNEIIGVLLNELSTISSNDYSVIIVQLGSVENVDKDKVIYLFSEIINIIKIIEHQDLLFFCYSNDYNIEFSKLINSINYDLNMNLKIYLSRKNLFISSLNESFFWAIILYLFDSESDNYFDISKIILKVVNINARFLVDIKTVVLKDFLKDQFNTKIALEMFENNLNVTKTSKQLYMHRNTLNYKLDYIYNITNLNLQVFNDAIAMYILINI